MSETAIIICPNCNNKLRVPNDKGAIMFTCPVCRSKWPYQGTAKVAGITPPPKSNTTASFRDSNTTKKQTTTNSSASINNVKKTTTNVSSSSTSNVNRPNPTPPVYSNRVKQTPPQPSTPKPQIPTRILRVSRGEHAYKQADGIGVKNMFKDSIPYNLYLDGVNCGTMKIDQPIVLNIDSREHFISQTPISAKFKLPAGNDSYVATFFNNKFIIGIVDDPFRSGLEQFVLQMVRGKGFRDRILDLNNHHKAVEVTIRPDYILVHYRLNRTTGLSEWSTGEKQEKIYYSQIGLTPTPAALQPGGYWEYLDNYIREAIINDNQADLCHDVGGFTIRTTHGLY